jgi:hypothetical protein
MVLTVVPLSPVIADTNPVFVVDEVFEDGAADGFFTGSGGLFNTEAQLGTVVDDGSGNHVYALSEEAQSQAFIHSEPVADFDLRFIATSLPGPWEPQRWGRGMVGVLFRFDPDGVDGYFLDSQTLFSLSDDGSGGVIGTEIASYDGPPPSVGSHEMRVRVIGDQIKVFRDGEPIISVTDSSHQMGHVGLVEINGGTVHVDDITLRLVPRAEQASG